MRFIHEGYHKGWRYKEGEVVLLPDGLAKLAQAEGMAVPVEKNRASNTTNPRATGALDQAKRR